MRKFANHSYNWRETQRDVFAGTWPISFISFKSFCQSASRCPKVTLFGLFSMGLVIGVYRDGFCEKQPEAFLSGSNASWLQDRSSAGQVTVVVPLG